VTVVSDTLSLGVGVIPCLVGYYGRDVHELASPLIQVLPEVRAGYRGIHELQARGRGS